jgi:hypothetical protein
MQAWRGWWASRCGRAARSRGGRGAWAVGAGCTWAGASGGGAANAWWRDWPGGEARESGLALVEWRVGE